MGWDTYETQQEKHAKGDRQDTTKKTDCTKNSWSRRHPTAKMGVWDEREQAYPPKLAVWPERPREQDQDEPPGAEQELVATRVTA